MEPQQLEPMQGWYPRELMARARQQPRDAFTRAYRSPLSLVVILDAPSSDLALGLKADTASDHDGLPFRTAALLGPRGPTPTRSSDPAAAGADLSAYAQAVRKLLEMANQCCHIIPIRKRAEAAFLATISVGRARNHDIVLRHASVSKFHANLEVEEGDRLFVKDAGSRNHTFLNHERINSRVEVKSGDNLRFGWVEAIVCTDEALWGAARGTAAAY